MYDKQLSKIEYDNELFFFKDDHFVSFQEGHENAIDVLCDFDNQVYRLLSTPEKEAYNKMIFKHLLKSYPEIWTGAKYDNDTWYASELNYGDEYIMCINWLCSDKDYNTECFRCHMIDGFYVISYKHVSPLVWYKLKYLLKDKN